jgi:formate hydrogenlyase transcriptional activator
MGLGNARERCHPLADPTLNEVHMGDIMNSNASPCETLAEQFQTLLEVSEAISTQRDLRELFHDLAQRLPEVVPFDYINVVLHEPDREVMRLFFLVTSQPSTIQPGLETPVDESPGGLVWKTQQPLIVNDIAREERFPMLIARLQENGVRSFCVVPLLSHEKVLGALNVGRTREEDFTPAECELLNQVAQQIAIAVENGLAFREIAQLKEKLAKEKLYLEEEILAEHNFCEIIGESRALKQILREVATVAAMDSTVLILGETGSGKELVARGLHNLSNRRERSFVKLNCAAIPTGLLESELFGHEKGPLPARSREKSDASNWRTAVRSFSMRWERSRWNCR